MYISRHRGVRQLSYWNSTAGTWGEKRRRRPQHVHKCIACGNDFIVVADDGNAYDDVADEDDDEDDDDDDDADRGGGGASDVISSACFAEEDAGRHVTIVMMMTMMVAALARTFIFSSSSATSSHITPATSRIPHPNNLFVLVEVRFSPNCWKIGPQALAMSMAGIHRPGAPPPTALMPEGISQHSLLLAVALREERVGNS